MALSKKLYMKTNGSFFTKVLPQAQNSIIMYFKMDRRDDILNGCMMIYCYKKIDRWFYIHPFVHVHKIG